VSATPTRRAISQALIGIALVSATAALCFRSGGFFAQPRTTIAILAWIAIAAVALLAGSRTLVPPSRPGRVAVVALLALAGWTALSVLWAPLETSARQDLVRLALYAAVLPLAAFAFRQRDWLRALEPALAALALAVVGYGLLGELGVLDLDASASADGRLDQPLSYWNAMGAMAAVGLVLCVRLGTDATRAVPLRAAGIAAAVPLAVGLYLTYSRGAVAAAVLGLAALALLAPEAGPLWSRIGRRSRRLAAVATAAALAAALVVVAGDDATPERGATAARLADTGSTRADYWRVAAGSFAAMPLQGAGTAGFRVEWLRERDVREGAVDAHSLYLETGGELGLVGLLLLGGFVVGVVLCASRVVSRDPALAAGACAALVALAMHAGIDWDWELPALVLPALLLAGALIAQDRVEASA
jgi:O-antigen ligase